MALSIVPFPDTNSATDFLIRQQQLGLQQAALAAENARARSEAQQRQQQAQQAQAFDMLQFQRQGQVSAAQLALEQQRVGIEKQRANAETQGSSTFVMPGDPTTGGSPADAVLNHDATNLPSGPSDAVVPGTANPLFDQSVPAIGSNGSSAPSTAPTSAAASAVPLDSSTSTLGTAAASSAGGAAATPADAVKSSDRPGPQTAADIVRAAVTSTLAPLSGRISQKQASMVAGQVAIRTMQQIEKEKQAAGVTGTPDISEVLDWPTDEQGLHESPDNPAVKFKVNFNAKGQASLQQFIDTSKPIHVGNNLVDKDGNVIFDGGDKMPAKELGEYQKAVAAVAEKQKAYDALAAEYNTKGNDFSGSRGTAATDAKAELDKAQDTLDSFHKVYPKLKDSGLAGDQPAPSAKPKPETSPTPAPADDAKVVVEKDGKRYRLPKSQLAEAQKQGYTPVDQ